MNEKTNKNYWLRLTPLYWLISLLYMCLQTLDFPNTQEGLVEFVLSSILCVVSAIFYEKKIGKIIAWIWVGIWFALLSFIMYLDYQDDRVSMYAVFADMIPSYRVFVLLNFVVALLIPVFLIFHQWILSHKRGKTLTILFIIFVLSCSIYTIGWTYFFQDKIVREKYREGKQLVAQIEDYKDIHGYYPTTLSKIDKKEEEGWFYNLSGDSAEYQISSHINPLFNRVHKNNTILTIETIEYDSETQKWTYYK